MIYYLVVVEMDGCTERSMEISKHARRGQEDNVRVSQQKRNGIQSVYLQQISQALSTDSNVVVALFLRLGYSACRPGAN